MSWRGCYDSLTEVFETLNGVSSMTHVRPCHVIAEIYRCHRKKPHKRDSYIRHVIGETPPSKGHALLETKYVSPDKKKWTNTKIPGWSPMTQYHAELVVRVLAARYRIKCKRCNRLHDDQRNKYKYKSYIEELEYPLWGLHLPAAICLDCAKRYPYDSPEQERYCLLRICEYLRLIGNLKTKGELTPKRLQSLMEEIELFA